jgi:hypothetical protein
MYWLINSREFVIQGVPNYNLDQTFPIGIHTKEKGTIKIEIGELENLPDITEIYLRDTSDSTYHDLKEEAFKAILPAGEYQDRYEIVFQDETKMEEEEEEEEEPEPEDNPLGFHYQIDKRKLVISNPELLEIKKIIIYSLTGQQVAVYSGIPIAKKVELDIEKPLSMAVYIVKVLTTKGDYSKKVIIRND